MVLVSYQNKSNTMQAKHHHQGGSLRPEAAKEINARVDCADLAERLGLEQPGGKGNWKNPKTDPKFSAAMAIYPADAKGGSRWKDHRETTHGGPIDLMMMARGMEFPDAVRELGKMYGIAVEKPREGIVLEERKQSLAEFIADNCWKAVRTPRQVELVAYLGGRGISEAVIERCIKAGTLGLNIYTNPKIEAGEVNHGGPAAAFIVKNRVDGQVMAVDMRYFDPALNGDLKTQSQGEKQGFPWVTDWKRVMAARTVYVCESSINVLSIESCEIPGTAALSIRGTGNVDTIDWSFLRGKQVVACMDNDLPFQPPHVKAGYCAGLLAAWRLHEVLTALDISCLLVDQGDWYEEPETAKGPINDVNDYLQQHGVVDTAVALQRLEPWMVPGMTGSTQRLGRPRIFLPAQDYQTYWKYRVTTDSTRVIGKTTKDDDGNEKHEYMDMCGFRVAAVSRVKIASDEATMTGGLDNAPTTMFALSVQTPRHGPVLQRRVVDDDKLYNIEAWRNFAGGILAPNPFTRMLMIWERAASIAARDAVNFVGLAWRDGKLALNEGPDCYFTEPTEQCPYYNLTFPSGKPSDGVEVVRQFQATFGENEAAIPLVWALGAHLKAFLGYWPHFVMQAEKGAGKSVVVKAIGTAIAMKQFSRQTMQTEYRIIGSVSYTSQPVAWGEFSTIKQDLRTKAIGTLQESYQYESTSRGIGLKRKFLMSAPVLMNGEDVPVDGLEGKLIRATLTKALRGELISEDCPTFPMRQWLQWLAGNDKQRVRRVYDDVLFEMRARTMAKADDSGAERMVTNYSAVATAWQLLCEFLEIKPSTGGFLSDLVKQMNVHIADTKASRHPWVWIVEKLLSEIARREFKYPFKFDMDDDEIPCLCVRTGHIMDHISQSPGLRAFWDELPIKSDRALKKQLMLAGVLSLGPDNGPQEFARTIGGRRVTHMVGLSLPALRQFGLNPVEPEGEER